MSTLRFILSAIFFISAGYNLTAIAQTRGDAIERTAPAETSITSKQVMRDRWAKSVQSKTLTREILNDASSHPEAGGWLFLQQFGHFCATVEESRAVGTSRARLDVNHVNFHATVVAGERLDRMCDSLSQEERKTYQNWTESASVAFSVGRRDPYLDSLRELRQANTPNTRRLAVHDALIHFDPVHLHMLLRPHPKKGIWFNGRWHAFNNEDYAAETLLYAKSLAECAFGISCDADDLNIAQRCMNDPSYCKISSRLDLIARIIETDGRPASILTNVQRTSKLIIDAIQRRQVDAFVAP